MVLYNTLSKQKEQFSPSHENSVLMYVCGITPYDTTHLGHAFTYIFFDTLYRYLLYKGYNVTYTQNVTDINDRDKDILERAKAQNVSWRKLADFWTEKFLDDMKTLNWIRPKNYLKASEQIATMIKLIEDILKSGVGYQINGGVYLDIKKDKDFGKLSRLSQEEMIKRAKEFDEDLTNKDKRHPLDITLWRPSEQNQAPHIPSFGSPFGKGRPGWHLECSAMSVSSLSQQIDIHGGGNDLIYPHHESEIAQTEAATGKIPFVKYWLHTGTVMYQGQKISKSLGNLVLVSDLLKNYSQNTIRWMLLSHHYRQPWEFTEGEIKKAESAVKNVESSLKNTGELKTETKEAFEKVLDNDMDTPKALEIITQKASKGQNITELYKLLGFRV